MGRTKLTVGAVVGALILLGWLWPTGAETVEEDRAAAEATADAESSTAEATDDAEPSSDPPEPPPTSSDASEPEPPQTDPVETTMNTGADEPEDEAEPAHPGKYGGPLGTRNHTGNATVALTFDDGPDPKWTPKVLDELRSRGVKATFCVIGAYAEAYPELIADIVHDGHTMCNHSWYHEFDLGTRGTEEIKANLQRTNDAIQKAAPGSEVTYFRHPGGMWTDRAIAAAADLGMESLHWSVDPSDWDKNKSEAFIRDHVKVKTEEGGIVLLHDGGANQKDMFGALKSIIKEFDRRGYTLVAL